MFNLSFTTPRAWTMRQALTISLVTCLVLLVVWHLRGVRPEAVRPAQKAAESAAQIEGSAASVEESALPQLEGEAARAYLEKTSEGKSLMKVLTAERFGLKRQERSPFDKKSGAGYLAMSHDQNLNAWFAEDGITVRPTLSEKDRDHVWQLGFRLKSYGYGSQMTAAAPVVSHRVKENRIEYERGANETGARVVEWYENQSAGIEQGFTLSARPAVRGGEVGADESLRLVMAVTGDLRARVKDQGQSIELSRPSGEGVLSYTKLVAVDADGKKLAARMEASTDGREIALVVDDKDAVYPLVIDPITATLENKLDAGGGNRQTDARFGFAVAIEGDAAVVGAWRHDSPSGTLDAGAVFKFTRPNRVSTSWSLAGDSMIPIPNSTAHCGSSVAISGDVIVFGCPGGNQSDGVGRAYIIRGNPNTSSNIPKLIGGSSGGTDDRFGTSIAIKGNYVLVGAPLGQIVAPDCGQAYLKEVDSNLTVKNERLLYDLGGATGDQFGGSVAIANDTLPLTIIVGVPGYQSGKGKVMAYNEDFSPGLHYTDIFAADGGAGDNFGNSVDIHGNTLVVGAYGDDDKGTDAGAAYVFVRDFSWKQQQKLTASDGRAGDHFSEHAVAIEGNTIVIGADEQDGFSSSPDPNRGEVYIYTRSDGTVWTQQASIIGEAAADNFGISVDISGNSVIVGARAANSFGNTRAGASYVYRLNCLPPSNHAATVNTPTACPGSFVRFAPSSSSDNAFQWRKNGAEIPGATGFFYAIQNMTPSDAGSYDVIITNACGREISTPVTLAIHTFSLNPTSQNFSASGSNGIVNVSSTGSCDWAATSNSSFITVTSGASGTGNGTVNFTVAPNPGASQRNGTLTIAGQTFTVTQDGTVPPTNTFQFSQSNYLISESAGSTVVTVTRAGVVSAPATVEYATTNGTASDRNDYNTTIGRLRFAAGETARTFSVLVNDDAFAEGTEAINLTLSNPAGGPSLGSTFTATININDNDAFTSTSNPIDTTSFFVRQNYVDFFSREPDAPGLSFWSNNIESCGADAACREVKRIDTSAAFFLSIEFQETGFLVHRLYRASFNRLTRYREFVRDSQEMGRNVVVGAPGWEAQLEANKQAFVSEFATRADFQAAYSAMTNAQYVDTLNTNTGGSLSQAERDALVAALNGGSETRATALRKIAEDADFRDRETSPAFVLLQYFGYLRRNPDDAPEPGLNFDGYNFWLGKLNSFGGDYRAAEMVKAFITSTEYRQRFGQP